jgi:hypothetical protein
LRLATASPAGLPHGGAADEALKPAASLPKSRRAPHRAATSAGPTERQLRPRPRNAAPRRANRIDTGSMADDRVRVYARIRPQGTSREEFGDAAVRCVGEQSVSVDDLEGAVNDSLRNSVQGGVAQAAASTRKFDFDGSFGGDSTQADVFSDVGAPVVRAVLQGYHGCIFAYGQTGSGKTFSLLNAGTPGRNFEDAGLLPRLVATLYVRAGADAAHQYAVECGAFQVYNEQVADLLHPEHRNGKGQNLSVSKKDGHGQVDNLTWKACASAKELLDHFAYARKNVIYAETKMNKASSRSHACFQLRVTRREKNSNKGSVSLCSVVDLAGSERVKRSGVAGKELKEAININGSLLALGNVVAALAAKKKHVPYRDSKLTRVLEGSVGGNCRTTLLCCASPAADSTSETLSALSFAQRAMRCECKAVVNVAEVGDFSGALGLVEIIPDPEADKRQRALVAAERKTNELSKEKEAALLKAKKQEEAAEAARREGKKQLEEARMRQKENQQLNLDLKKLTEEKTTVQSELSRVKEDAQKDRKALQLKLDQITKEKDSLAKESARLKNEKGSLEKKLTETTTDLTKAQASLKTSEATVVKLGKELDSTKTELSSVKKELNARAALSQDEVAKEREERRMEAEQLRGDVEAKTEEVSTLTEKCAGLEGKLAEADDSVARAACAAALTAVNAEAELRAVRDDHNETLEASKAEADKRLADANEAHRKREEGALQSHMKTVASLEDERKAVEKECSTIRKERDHVESELVQAKDEISRLGDGLAKTEGRRRSLEASLQALEERAMSDSQKSSKQIDEARQELSATKEKLRDETSAKERLTREKARLETEVKEAIEETEAARRHHAEAVETLEEKHEVHTRRVAWAFSCARSIEKEKTRCVLGDLQNLQRRFDARESRADDLKQIAVLKKRVASADQARTAAARSKKRTELELENERRNDQIFGALSAHAVQAKNRKRRDDAKRAHYQPPGARAVRAGGALRREPEPVAWPAPPTDDTNAAVAPPPTPDDAPPAWMMPAARVPAVGDILN